MFYFAWFSQAQGVDKLFKLNGAPSLDTVKLNLNNFP